MPVRPHLLNVLEKTLEEHHAKDIDIFDVRQQTSVTDYMIVCTGRSSRQVKSIASLTEEKMKKEGLPSLSSQGTETGDWILVDFGDYILNVMQPESRSFYDLEGLWGHPQNTNQ